MVEHKVCLQSLRTGFPKLNILFDAFKFLGVEFVVVGSKFGWVPLSDIGLVELLLFIYSHQLVRVMVQNRDILFQH